MIKDLNVLTTIQMAFVGIVVVVGFFLVWRRLSRLEERLDDHIASMSSLKCTTGGDMPMMAHSLRPEDAEEAEAFMQEVFGSPIYMSSANPCESSTNAIQITEEPTVISNTATTPVSKPLTDDDGHSEATDGGMSKSKIKKMNIDALRDICKEKGLSTEGTRAMLIERVISCMEDGQSHE